MAAQRSSATEHRTAEVLSDVGLCQAVLGEPLTAYLSGADTVGQYRRWLTAGGEEFHRRIAPRLAAARRVILSFRARNEVTMAQPWLREVSVTGDVPARFIRDKGDDETVGATLAEAAAQWLNERRPWAEVPA